MTLNNSCEQKIIYNKRYLSDERNWPKRSKTERLTLVQKTYQPFMTEPGFFDNYNLMNEPISKSLQKRHRKPSCGCDIERGKREYLWRLCWIKKIILTLMGWATLSLQVLRSSSLMGLFEKTTKASRGGRRGSSSICLQCRVGLGIRAINETRLNLTQGSTLSR